MIGENIGATTIDLMFHHTRIIVNNQIIDNSSLNWRHETNGNIELTLNEIAEQVNSSNVIYVWIELGLSGVIFLYNNYGDGKWINHGTTKGYA